jgi:hypothetical protein
MLVAPFLLAAFLKPPASDELIEQLLVYASNHRLRFELPLLESMIASLTPCTRNPVLELTTALLKDYSIPPNYLSVLLTAVLQHKEVEAVSLVVDRFRFKYGNDRESNYVINKYLSLKVAVYYLTHV